MSMSKKDFIALADALRPVINGPIMVHETGKETRTIQGDLVDALCRFMSAQNPRFKEQRWRAYLAGECGSSGGKLKSDVIMENLAKADEKARTGAQRAPKTGQTCPHTSPIERDNCPTCEGTGQKIDFAAIRAQRRTL